MEYWGIEKKISNIESSLQHSITPTYPGKVKPLATKTDTPRFFEIKTNKLTIATKAREELLNAPNHVLDHQIAFSSRLKKKIESEPPHHHVRQPHADHRRIGAVFAEGIAGGQHEIVEQKEEQA